MKIRREVSSIPYRSASETWQRVIDLVTASDSVDAHQLRAAAPVVTSIITDEHPGRRPIVFEGVGAQLRVYCCYGLAAVETGGAVDALTWNPTGGDWAARIPCDSANLDWVRSALSKTAPRLKVYDVDHEEAVDQSASANKGSGDLVVDWDLKG